MPASSEFQRRYQFGTLVIWPPDDVRQVVGALRQRFDPASQAICDAHITLTMPFRINPADDDLISVSSIAHRFFPMRIGYGPLASFLPYPCVYLEISPFEPLKELQVALYRLEIFDLSLPFSDPQEFTFHMSITDGYPDSDQTRHILDSLRGQEPCGEFEADAMAWIRPDKDFRFATVTTFPPASRTKGYLDNPAS